MTKHLSKKVRKIILAVLALILFGIFAAAYGQFGAKTDGIKISKPTPKVPTGPTISITPNTVEQGEPALITARGVTSISSVKSFTFNNLPLVMFINEGQVTALLGVDLRALPGEFPVVLTLHDGRELNGSLVIRQRKVVQAPFEIPEKLGGNTPESEKELISTLQTEAKLINAIPTGSSKLWTEKFRSPLNGPLIVTDPYGYTRLTGQSTLSHRGTDFQAPIGTPVFAMNRGTVRSTDNLRNYGNIVVIDHGLGLQTIYMHLSSISANLGQTVEKGDLVGYSGDTGYVLGPHLHVSVKIWDISIDPMKFLDLLGEDN